MLGPLVPLALGAIFAGWYANDWFDNDTMSSFWRGAIFVRPADESIAAGEQLPEWEKVMPLYAAALPGIFFAYIFYMLRPTWPGKVAQALGGLYRLVFNKYYFDEIYDFVFVRGAMCLGDIFWKQGDDGIIDAYGPDGAAKFTGRVAKLVGGLQTGYVYHYAFAMVIGLAAFVTWFWVRG
jgi:NADH-quinone oxidoreductase subunit L